MKHLRSLTILSLISLLAAGCVSTSTHKKSVDEAAALSANLSALTAEHGKLQDQTALCSKDLANSERRWAETQKQLDEKQIALERAQADIVRIEKVLSDRNQEAGKTMTQMRQEIDRLTTEIHKVKEERAQLIAERDRLTLEKENREKELRAAQDTYGELIDKMRSEISRGEVTISELQGKLTVNLVEKILFDSGSADIKSGGKEVLSKVGTILNEVEDKEIRVEGYSDNLPISPRLKSIYPSNWELSAARAISVVEFLRNTLNIPGERLSASGFAEFRPIADNGTPEGRAQNRRIQIILAPLEAEVVK
ncbi:MAG: chemotaxis protein MotB [Deltaproteobacteria bacterium HGW-Deltaproteobacteria-4]|nr:MAG: chemotaxis protein MotB [Deltaproteobacteria bacterium HGW-Deltaproteobacteria-4]